MTGGLKMGVNVAAHTRHLFLGSAHTRHIFLGSACPGLPAQGCPPSSPPPGIEPERQKESVISKIYRENLPPSPPILAGLTKYEPILCKIWQHVCFGCKVKGVRWSTVYRCVGCAVVYSRQQATQR